MANDLVVEVGDLVGPTIAVRLLQDLDRIAAIAHMGALGVHSAVLLGSIRILDRAADPEATFGIEGHVDRFVDHRLAGEKLNLNPPGACSFVCPSSGVRDSVSRTKRRADSWPKISAGQASKKSNGRHID